jgi:flagellar basal body P-ring formation protein FlgA
MKSLLRFSFLAACILVAGPGNQAGAQVSNEWQLLSNARVDGSGIFLDQLVQLAPPVVLPRLRLALAPPLGQTVLLTRQQITAILETNSPDLATTNWTGGRQVRVSRRTRQLAEPELLDLLTNLFQREEVKSRGQLELHLTMPWTPIAVPDEPLTVKIADMPPGGISPSFLAGIEMWSGQPGVGRGPERVGSWQLGLRARVWRQIAVAHSTLNRGQLLKDADVIMQRSDILVVRDALPDLSSADPALELSENVPAGLPVLARAVKIRPLVHRGRIVEGIFREGTLVISLKVLPMEDGILGQTVRVRNPKTGRELNGKVENEQTILITL